MGPYQALSSEFNLLCKTFDSRCIMASYINSAFHCYCNLKCKKD